MSTTVSPTTSTTVVRTLPPLLVKLPDFLAEESQAAILQRMLLRVPDTIDKSDSSPIFATLSPAAVEFAFAVVNTREALRRGFAQSTEGRYLDFRANEHGVFRIRAQPATGLIQYTGTVGTVIPLGTRMSTATTATTVGQAFSTTQTATIPGGGSVLVPIQAVTPGAPSNVMSDTIVVQVDRIVGVTGITNPEPTENGADIESDAHLLYRLLMRVRQPSAGGNVADYVTWALAVPGVGGVYVVPVRDGAGTVSVAILDANKLPAPQDLIDDVQAVIAPFITRTYEAESTSPTEYVVRSGAGISIDSTQIGVTGSAVRLVYAVPVGTPAAPTLTASAVGGTLATATYGYRIAAVSAFGETLPGPGATVAVTGPTGSVALTWPAAANAASYNVYGRTPGGELLLVNVAGTSYTDTGAAPLGRAPLTADTAGGPGVISQTLIQPNPPLQVIALLPQAGLYLWRVRLAVDSLVGTNPLLEVAVINDSQGGQYAATIVSGPLGQARTVYRAADLLTGYGWVYQPFYWNGTDYLHFSLRRLNGVTLANPTAAPTLTAQTPGTPLQAGTYTVAYSWRNEVGATLLSPTAAITLTAGQQITVTLPTLPEGVRNTDIYVSDAAGSTSLRYIGNTAGTSFVVVALPADTAATPPTTNTTAPDTTTTIWVDEIQYTSTFSDARGGGKAPIGAKVSVIPGIAQYIAVQSDIILAPGAAIQTVQNAILESIVDYFADIAYTEDPTQVNVRISSVGQAILASAGVIDYRNLLLNGAASNINIAPQEVPVLAAGSPILTVVT